MPSLDNLSRLKARVEVYTQEMTTEYTDYAKWLGGLDVKNASFDIVVNTASEKQKRLVAIMVKLISAYKEYTEGLEKLIPR